MTLSSTSPTISYATDGSTVAFDFTFPLVTNVSSEISVVLHDIAADTDTTLVENTHYTVSAPNNDYSSGGTVTTISAYATGYNIVISTNLTVKQETSLPHGGAFPPKTVETMCDYLTRLIQQIMIAGGVTFTEATTYIKTLLNDASATEARRTLDVFATSEIVCNVNHIVCNQDQIVLNL